MLSTRAETRQVSQWKIETRYNEYYTNRYICLLEEKVDRILNGAGRPTDEHAQYLVFSLWNVEMAVSSRLMEDEEKSSLLEVFGWLPAVVQLRRGSIYVDPRSCSLDLVNLTTRKPLQHADFSSFWHFTNRWLKDAPRAVFHPAKIGLLSLCEQSTQSQPHWEDFLNTIGFSAF
jgi:hypothetical protein